MLFSLPTLAEPQHFSVVEKVLFAAMIVASGYLFWRRFGGVLNKILKSKKDADFHLFPLGKRVWDFVWEVLCQAKVIRERPLPGLAHALVFWAFLRLCAGHAEPLRGRILGVGFLSIRTERLGGSISILPQCLRVACAVGILGLFVRRFLVRPKWLGESSPGSRA